MFVKIQFVKLYPRLYISSIGLLENLVTFLCVFGCFEIYMFVVNIIAVILITSHFHLNYS